MHSNETNKQIEDGWIVIVNGIIVTRDQHDRVRIDYTAQSVQQWLDLQSVIHKDLLHRLLIQPHCQ